MSPGSGFVGRLGCAGRLADVAGCGRCRDLAPSLGAKSWPTLGLSTPPGMLQMGRGELALEGSEWCEGTGEWGEERLGKEEGNKKKVLLK